MILATWNVNSIRMREDRLLRWLSSRQPDVVCLQELKCPSEEFPRGSVEAAGYQAAVLGQRSYNGVAILARSPLLDVQEGLRRKDLDEEARLLAATVDGVRVVCAYVPAGGEDNRSPRYQLKLKWIRTFIQFLADQPKDIPLVVTGDFNIAPAEIDLANVDKWRNSAIFNAELTNLFQDMLALGLADCFRLHQSGAGHYTWWDYHDLGYQRNEGTRVDHILMTASLQDRCYRCWVDWEERGGQKPSDHAPLLADFDWSRARTRDSAFDSGGSQRRRAMVAPADVAYGADVAARFIRDLFSQIAPTSPDAAVHLRWPNGYEEPLTWNYFPAGARYWRWNDSDAWYDLTGRPVPNNLSADAP